MRPRVSQFHNLDSFYPRNATNQNWKQLALIVGFKKMLKCKIVSGRRKTHDDGRRLIAIGHLSVLGDLKHVNCHWILTGAVCLDMGFQFARAFMRG